MLFRASVAGADANGGPNPAPACSADSCSSMRYQDSLAEASARVTYTDSGGRFSDGTRYELRVPRYSFRGLISTLPSHLLTSPRVAQVNFGLGLLEAVPEATIRALADPNDADGDGISGRYNVVYDVPLRDYIIGRFGWKANVGSLLHQAAGAFNGDMGITSSFFPSENCEGEFAGCRSHAPEVAIKQSRTSRSTRRHWPCRRGATWTTRSRCVASSCSTRSVAMAATSAR